VVWVVILGILGCQGRNRVARRPVDQIYREAVQASAKSRAAVEAAKYHPLSTTETFQVSQNRSSNQKLIQAKVRSNSKAEVTREEFEDEEPSDYGDYFLDNSDVELVDFQDEAIETPVPSAMQSTMGPNRGEIPVNEQRVSETFDQTEIREALSILASTVGAQVVVDDTVSGVVSAEIIDATFEQSLQQVLAPLGYEFSREDNQYFICPPDPSAPLFNKISQRSSYQSRYQNVTQMVELLPERYQPFLKVSEQRNLVSIDAPPRLVRELQSRLAELDQPVPQVELEAIVCVVSPESGFRFGLDWKQAVTVNGADSFAAGITGLAFNSTVSENGLRNAFSNFSVTSAFVRALASEGYLSIRAAPRVTARDGEKAQISIARETFFSLQPSSSNVLFRQDVQKVEAGIGLDIIPRIRGDIIQVQIDRAEVSENINSNESNPSATNFPVINRRTVSTNVDVSDGETIVIGGLVQRQQVEQINRIPGLSRIPLAGRLFQTKQVEEMDVEVAIFISPRIVAPPATHTWNSSNTTSEFVP
jgi:type II secretory pathway component GspD/PulD (secretin)